MNKKIRVFEAFAGYGSQSIALRNIGVDYEVVAISEIDKYAIKAYEAIHGKVNNLGDISKVKVEDIPDHDLFTYSFPCQDISVAGKQASLEEGSGTRSSLLWECRKIIATKKPRYLLMENVKNLVSKKHKPYFDKWLEYLEGLGYINYWQVLNAKDFGVPQNRERVFVVSILNNENEFNFEDGIELDRALGDMLEESVDEKYYIDTDRAKSVIQQLIETNQLNNDIVPCDSTIVKPKKLDISNCITARYDAGIQNKQSIGVAVVERIKDYNNSDRIGGLFDDDKKHQAGSIWNTNALSPTLDTMQGGYRQPCIVDKYRLRKLTPRECFRLMGLNEIHIDRIQSSGISNSQQYKMAGNSIVVQVLESIFKELLLS